MATPDRTRQTAWVTPKGDGRRQAILDALRELLADRPFAEISVSDLTRRAGVTRSAYYFYFPTKSAAVAALLTDLHERMFALTHEWYEGGPGTAEERLREGLTATVESWRRNPAWSVAMLEAARSDAEVGKIWRDYVDLYVRRVAERIELDRTPDSRSLSSDALATGLVDLMFSMMEHDVRAIVAAGEGLPEVVETLVHVWVAAIYGSR